MRKSEKPFFVANLTEQLKSAKSIVLVDYTGLTVKMQQELKKRLREIGAEMSVVKNTLFKMALRKARDTLGSHDTLDTLLTGPTAMIISEADPITPLQVLYKFAKEFELPQFKVGLVEGKFQDKESLEKLAQLPSKEILYGKFVGTLSQPLYGLVSALQGNLQKLVFILGEYTKSKGWDSKS